MADALDDFFGRCRERIRSSGAEAAFEANTEREAQAFQDELEASAHEKRKPKSVNEIITEVKKAS